jgi:hypothetical protein
MSDHLSRERMNKYSEKKLPPKELLQVDEHLSICENCRNKLTVDSDPIAGLFELEQPEHLTYDQLVSYLDKQKDRDLVESHLEVCSRCKSEYADLRAFSMELAAPAYSKKTFYRVLAVAAVLTAMALVASLLYRDSPVQQARQTPKRTPIVASINDAGTRLTLDQDGKLSGLKDVPVSYQEMVRVALQTNALEISEAVHPLITKTGFVRGESQEGLPFPLVKPVGTVVLSDRPVFEWASYAGASKYKVTILDTNMNVAATSDWLTTTTWAPDQPLQRDAMYIWQVAAFRKGQEILSPQPPAGEARFRILDAATHRKVEQEREQYSDSLLLLGLLYARYGLLDDAAHNFQKLARTNPGSDQVRQLQSKLESFRKVVAEHSPS